MLQKLQLLWKGLKDFFHYNYLFLLGKPIYPKAILPKKNFRSLLDIDVMSEHLPLYVVRRADFACDDIFNEAGVLKDSIISYREVPGLSMNLLGSFYLLKHLKFRASGNGAAYWPSNTTIYISEFLHDYSIADLYCPLIYDLATLHDTVIPFINNQNRDTKKFIEAFNLTPEISGSKYELKGKMKIKHEPINLNYWHVELKLIDTLGKEVTRDAPSAWYKSAKKHIVEHCLSVPITEIKDIQTIDKRFYIA